MQRPGRVGRDIFHVDRPAAAQGRGTIGRPGPQNLGQAGPPEGIRQAQVDKAGSGDIGGRHLVEGGQPRRQLFRQIARFQAARLGQHHGGVGRNVAMRPLPAWLDDDPRGLGAGGNSPAAAM
jgi:hypothetical protein